MRRRFTRKREGQVTPVRVFTTRRLGSTARWSAFLVEESAARRAPRHPHPQRGV